MSSTSSPSSTGTSQTVTMNPRRLKGHEAAATCCIASRSKPTIIVSSGEDGRMCLFDLRCRDAVRIMEAEGPISSICFKGGNEDIIYASSGTEIASFDTRSEFSWKQLETYNYNKEEINQISFSPKSSFLAAADDSGDVKIIDISQQCLYKTLRSVHTSICSSVQFHSWKPWSVVTGGLDSKLAMWDFSRGRPYNVMDYGIKDNACVSPAQSFNPAFVHCVAVPEEDISAGLNKVCAVARGDGVVDVIDESELATAKSNNSGQSRKGSKGTDHQNKKKRLQLDYTFGGHQAAVSCVSFSMFGEKGKFIISGGNDSLVKMWDWSPHFNDGKQIPQDALHLSISAGEKVNWLCTTAAQSENLVICDTSKVIKVYSIS